MVEGLFTIINRTQLTDRIVDLWIDCPAIAKEAMPGQFVMLGAPGYFLRRPISICQIDRAGGFLRLVFEIKGGGTRALAGLDVNMSVKMLGPLGRGFSVPEGKRAILIGGGIGTPPMLSLAMDTPDVTAILGFRNADAVILKEEFDAVCGDVILCTDDGSGGEKGFVTDALQRLLGTSKPDLICACGPIPMLRCVAQIANSHHLPAQLSLEERMACGVGACRGCGVHMLDENGKRVIGRVCKDGPVFSSDRILL